MLGEPRNDAPRVCHVPREALHCCQVERISAKGCEGGASLVKEVVSFSDQSLVAAPVRTADVLDAFTLAIPAFTTNPPYKHVFLWTAKASFPVAPSQSSLASRREGNRAARNLRVSNRHFCRRNVFLPCRDRRDMRNCRDTERATLKARIE